MKFRYNQIGTKPRRPSLALSPLVISVKTDKWRLVQFPLFNKNLKNRKGGAVRREIAHEPEGRVRYLGSDGIPAIIISLYCDYESGKIKLSDELIDYTWITVDKLGKYKFVPGLREKIELVDNILKKDKQGMWRGKYDSTFDRSLRDSKS